MTLKPDYTFLNGCLNRVDDWMKKNCFTQKSYNNEKLSDFEEWKQDFEALKEPDGSIDLSKHHEFIRISLGLPRKNIDWKNLPNCYGDTVSYELPKLVE